MKVISIERPAQPERFTLVNGIDVRQNEWVLFCKPEVHPDLRGNLRQRRGNTMYDIDGCTTNSDVTYHQNDVEYFRLPAGTAIHTDTVSGKVVGIKLSEVVVLQDTPIKVSEIRAGDGLVTNDNNRSLRIGLQHHSTADLEGNHFDKKLLDYIGGDILYSRLPKGTRVVLEVE